MKRIASIIILVPSTWISKSTLVCVFCTIYCVFTKRKSFNFGRDLQDGGRVRHGDHLPPHKYIKNTSTCRTTPTEHLLNSGRRPQTSQKARKSPHIGKGKREKNKQKQKNKDGTCNSGRELWKKKSFHTLGSPFTGGDRGWVGDNIWSHEGEDSNGVQRAKQRDSHTENWCQPALTSLRGLSAHPLGWVGAGSWGSGFGGQTPGRGLRLPVWGQPEGASAQQIARRESGKKSGPA